ncbi:tetraacyldisaccharide 4'-kinase, partial [Acinetobacter baumannii]
DFKRSIWVVPVKAVLSTECYQILNQQLQKLDIQIS